MIVKVLGGYLEVDVGGGGQPGQPPGIWGPPGPWPTPPIHFPPGQGGGGQPPGIWGGPIDPYPDHGLPGRPGTWPPQRPPHPAHPIVLPPDSIKPPIPIPPTIWPNPPEGTAPHPEHPIVYPDPIKPPDGVEGPALEVQVIWTAQTGWAVVLVPTGEHVAPSA